MCVCVCTSPDKWKTKIGVVFENNFSRESVFQKRTKKRNSILTEKNKDHFSFNPPPTPLPHIPLCPTFIFPINYLFNLFCLFVIVYNLSKVYSQLTVESEKWFTKKLIKLHTQHTHTHTDNACFLFPTYRQFNRELLFLIIHDAPLIQANSPIYVFIRILEHKRTKT